MRFQSGGNTTYVRELRRGLMLNPEIDVAFFGSRRARTPIGRAMAQTAESFAPLKVGSEVLHYTGDTGPLARNPRGRPVVTTVHGFAGAHVQDGRTPLSRSVWVKRVRRAISLSDHIITDSYASRADIVDRLGGESSNLSVVYLGIDHERFNTSVEALDLPLPESAPVLLFLGNIEPRKNLVRAIDGFCQSELPSAGWHFLIAGRLAWNFEDTLRRIAAEDQVTYLGPVENADVPRLMKRADAFIFPSLYEGFGLPPLEAMAVGTPVISSSRGSLAEVLESAAYIVDPDDPGSIADGLSRLIDDGFRSQLIELGLARARSFSWEKATRQHVEVYRSVCQP